MTANLTDKLNLFDLIENENEIRVEPVTDRLKTQKSKKLTSKKLKRSSSESKLKTKNDLNTSNSSLFKSKSSRNLNNGKLIKTFVRNQNSIRIYDSVPSQHMPPLHITNQDEVKKKFIDSKIPPVLKFKADNRSVQNMLTKHGKTNYDHFFIAKNILETVKSKHPDLVSYFEANFGKRISSDVCVDLIGKYLSDNKINGDLEISFAPGLTCSGRITSSMQNKDPTTRKFFIWINDGDDNQFLRKKGIISLCDHEIGTHYFRAFNDGLQIWFNERKKFGLRPLNSNELLRTEEGIAALHTLMNANLKYLFLPALLYYLACMANTMTFEQLYNHMEAYIEIPEERWKLVTRVKRGISDPHQIGGYARDQSYLEGAIDILRNLDNIDFITLMSGKICLDELDRVKRISRINSIKLPKFMRDIHDYKEKLRWIGIVNGIIEAKESGYEKNGKLIIDQYLNENVNEEYDFKYFKADRNETDDLFKLNSKTQYLTSIEIKRFINKEIVFRTKTSLSEKPKFKSIDKFNNFTKANNVKNNNNNNNSSFCVIL